MFAGPVSVIVEVIFVLCFTIQESLPILTIVKNAGFLMFLAVIIVM